MSHALQLHHQLHRKALDLSSRYRRAEGELIEVLQQVESHHVHFHHGCASLYQYVVQVLSLSESVAYNLIAVARKARAVPELKRKIEEGVISLSNARKIAPVLTVENQAEWLKKASTLSQRQLEKEVVKFRPSEATSERARYVTESRVKLELGLSEEEMLKLRRAQDILSQARRRSVSLEEVLTVITREYLKRNDPLERAKRVQVKKGLRVETLMEDLRAPTSVPQNPPATAQTATIQHEVAPVDLPKGLPNSSGPERPKYSEPSEPPTQKLAKKTGVSASEIPEPVSLQVHDQRTSVAVRKPRNLFKRKRLSVVLLHRVNLRDRRRCAFVSSRGERCGQSRFLEIHHRRPVSRGGEDTLENLITLCSSHHTWIHSPAASQAEDSDRAPRQ